MEEECAALMKIFFRSKGSCAFGKRSSAKDLGFNFAIHIFHLKKQYYVIHTSAASICI